MEQLDKAVELNNTTTQHDQIDLCRKPTQQQKNTHSFQAPMKHTKVYYLLGHKINLNKLKIIRIIQSVFSDHIGLSRNQQQKNNRKIFKHLDSILINNSWVK